MDPNQLLNKIFRPQTARFFYALKHNSFAQTFIRKKFSGNVKRIYQFDEEVMKIVIEGSLREFM